jgi:hypothetical protein
VFVRDFCEGVESCSESSCEYDSFHFEINT